MRYHDPANTRRRQAQKGSNKNKLWYRVYRKRMRGAETCRQCGTRRNLSFAHMTPLEKGGRFQFDNLTILCVPCNSAQSNNIWPHQISLAEEEAAAPPERQWYRLAWLEATGGKTPVAAPHRFDPESADETR